VLYTEKLLAELERQRDAFARYSARFGRQIEAYRAALHSLGERYPSSSALEAALSAREQTSGARPTAEYDRWRALQPTSGKAVPALPFAPSFANHEEARAWAECLRGVTTVAVDGSQLLPWRDASLPVAIVQAGVYENPHEPPEAYLKDVVTVVLTPEELFAADEQEEQGDETRMSVAGQADRMVHLRRFELEVETLIVRMRIHAERRASGPEAPERPIVVFCDGSLIVSFALKMSPTYRDRYVRAARRLLAASEEHRVPVVGYIDTSYARDLITMTRAVDGADRAGGEALPKPRGVHDALLFRGRLGWGDRTPAFFSARDDLSRMGYEEQRGEVAFTYFQAALDRPPARLEFPRWVLDGGLLDQVMDVVRAETIVGNGYPYPIEAADAVAVISARDRAQFYALFQGWAEREGLPFTISRKALSKSRRRV
jgi:NurA domain-containing protein